MTRGLGGWLDLAEQRDFTSNSYRFISAHWESLLYHLLSLR